ncbi:MAG: hypothetical protein V1922_04540 [bacterium]
MKIKKLTEQQDLENARVKYSSVLDTKNSEGEIQWNRYNAILVANTIFISLFTFAASNTKQTLILKATLWIMPILGIVLCILWHKMTERGFIWTNFWMQKANEIENQIDGQINPIQEGEKLRNTIGEQGMTKKAASWIIIIFILIYVLMMVGNILPLLRLDKLF